MVRRRRGRGRLRSGGAGGTNRRRRGGTHLGPLGMVRPEGQRRGAGRRLDSGSVFSFLAEFLRWRWPSADFLVTLHSSAQRSGTSDLRECSYFRDGQSSKPDKVHLLRVSPGRPAQPGRDAPHRRPGVGPAALPRILRSRSLLRTHSSLPPLARSHVGEFNRSVARDLHSCSNAPSWPACGWGSGDVGSQWRSLFGLS